MRLQHLLLLRRAGVLRRIRCVVGAVLFSWVAAVRWWRSHPETARIRGVQLPQIGRVVGVGAVAVLGVAAWQVMARARVVGRGAAGRVFGVWVGVLALEIGGGCRNGVGRPR